MGTYFTDLATTDPLVAAVLNNVLDELDTALQSEFSALDLNFGEPTELTISSGAVTLTGSHHTIDTEGNVIRDHLDTINGGETGDLLLIRPENTNRTVVVRHAYGNIVLAGRNDVTLDETTDYVVLLYTGNYWVDILGSLASGSSIYGYFAGGNTGAVVTTADRLAFSTGVTAANTASNLSQARYGLAGVSDISLYGYFGGGYTGAVVATADRLTFSTGATAANTASNLSQARYDLAGVSDGSLYGYFAGGSTGAVVATADRLTFSTGATAANTASNLSQARYYLAGASDGSLYGYFAGGATGANVAVVTADRIVFSTGATAANTTSNLSQARYGLAGVSDGSV